MNCFRRIFSRSEFTRNLTLSLTVMAMALYFTACWKSPSHMSVKELKALEASYPVRNITGIPEIQQYLKENKIYLSLTTIPGRISKVHHVLDTIQLDPLEKMFLNLPIRFGRDGSEYEARYCDDSYWGNYQGRVQVLRQAKDLGPITKMLPSIQHLKDLGEDDATLIVVDDDTAYPAGMVPEIINAMVQHPNTVVAGSAQDLSFWQLGTQFPKSPENRGFGCSNAEESYCDVVEGFGGIGLKPKYIDVELMLMLSDSRFSRECFSSDDLVVSFSLALSRVNRMKIRNEYFGTHRVHQFSYGFEEDALHRGGGLLEDTSSSDNMNGDKYRTCYNKLLQLTVDPVTGKYKDVPTIKAEWTSLYGAVVKF